MSEILTDDEMVKMIREQADELENCAAAMRAAGAEIDRLRLALETATRERDEAREERASYEAKLAVKWLLEEEYEASCHDRDAMARMCDDLRRTIRTVFALIADWRDGNVRLGRPRSFVDQRFMDALAGVKTDQITEVKLIVEGQRGGTATFTHWSGTATKPEEP